MDATVKVTQKSCYRVNRFLLRFHDRVRVRSELQRRVSAATQILMAETSAGRGGERTAAKFLSGDARGEKDDDVRTR